MQVKVAVGAAASAVAAYYYISKRPKRFSSQELEAEETAEAEIAAAIAAAKAAPADEEIAGLHFGVAPVYFKVEPKGKRPWQYRQPRGKPLVFAYLIIRGLGETVRLMLAEAGIPYEHFAITMAEPQSVALEWRKRSPTALMPMMSGIGVPRATPLCQSRAIIRYVAACAGMDGGDEASRARVDMMFETAKDLGEWQDKIISGEPDSGSKKSFANLFASLTTMLEQSPSAADPDAALNFAQLELLKVLLAIEERAPGAVKSFSLALDNFRTIAAARPRIAAYLASPMRFPMTCNEAGIDGKYKYAKGALRRSAFMDC